MSSNKKKRRASGEGSKQPSIKDAFSKQAAAGALPSLRAVLEVRRAPKVVPEVFLEEALKIHEMYREEQGAASRAIAAASGLRRSSRRRTRSKRFSDDTGGSADDRAKRGARRSEDGSGSGDDSDDPLAAGLTDGAERAASKDGSRQQQQEEEDEDEEAEYARALCERWQGHATAFIATVSKWVSANWMLPLALQECLVHFVANHELHSTDPSLSLNALRLLQRIAAHHPHAEFLGETEDLPPRVVSHEEVWHPLLRDSTLIGRLGASGFQLAQRLVAGALELATGARDASAPVGGAGGGGSDSGDGSVGSRIGPQGRALLLHYVTGLLQSDLAARLRVWRAARCSDDGGARAAETVLQGALLWRLLQDDNSWTGARGDKAQLVRALAVLAVAGQAERPASAGAAVAGQQQRPDQQRQGGGAGGGSADAPVPALLRVEALRSLGVRLLRLLFVLLGAAEEAGLYSDSARQRIRTQSTNDRAQLDRALLGVLLGNDVPPALKHPASKGDLLSALPGRDRVRLVSIVAAEAYARSWKAKNPCEHLESLHAYALDQGKGAAAFVAGDAGAVAGYLASHYAWAAKALAAGSLDGATVLAAQLVLGAAEEADARGAQAAAEAGAKAAQAAAAGGGRGRGAKQPGAGSDPAAAAASAAAAAFPSEPVRRLLDAARGADGFGALQVEVREALAAAEAAAARLGAAGGGAA
ncbi:hypothetical protein Rsub_10626 [Raphidocelis subcapitata]|uniref:Uncharacterized protein n=1 Tax=Raphidocelis subcapitata TaxID=307507 RepID=A0A2V0PJ06_9CHLO|nr:hypothetical protein Rsub_10626 [Raphidocelis subcapitata]|eukprot:GBF97953.1 hypothetical protein Rsub_10626 [Raphidocelis subcapitata]